jgi:2'-5' RNA ligase
LSDVRVRGSAIGINLPELAPLLSQWREPRVSASPPDVPPHITLLVPWRPAPVTASDIADAVAAISGVRPFRLSFRTIDRFASAGVLYLRPEPEEPVRLLMRRLLRVFPDTPPYGGAVTGPTPHLTVAVASSGAELDRLQREVAAALEPHLPLRALVREITIAEEQDDGSWAVAHTIPLTPRP